MADDDAPLRLTWKPTGLGTRRDFVGRDPDNPHMYARIYYVDAGAQAGQWYWTAAGSVMKLGTGFAPEKGTAARDAEAAYFGASGQKNHISY